MQNSCEQSILHFFCDESFIKLEGKKHILIGIIAVNNREQLLKDFIDLKKGLGIKVFEEIKWNSDKFKEEERINITNDFLNLECPWEGILLFTEYNQMEVNTFDSMMDLIELYVNENEANYYTLTLDQDFVKKPKSVFLTWKNSKSGNKCIQFDIVDSQTNQLIQCADLFAGFYNNLLSNFARNREKIIQLSEDSGYGMSVEAEISWMIKIAFRYKLWGDNLGFRENDIGPFKNSFGKGFKIIQSTISAELYEKIEKFFSEIYMGCIH